MAATASLGVFQTPQTKRSVSSITSIKETPLKLNWASSGVFIKGTLQDQRQAVANDLGGGIPEVDISYMMEHILPRPPSDVDIDASFQILQAGHFWSFGKGWRPFNGLRPSLMNGTEEEIFNRNMEIVVKDILGNCKFSKNIIPLRGVGIGTSPNLAPVSATNVRSRPDACGLLESFNSLHTSKWYTAMPETGLYHWFNIVYTLEYKKKNNVDARNDNVLKMLWSLHHVMNMDHRRRFTYGITIEDTTARVWFCCRQIVMVSTPFDFIVEPKMFIKIFTSLHYSTVRSLGFDPTMSYIWSSEENKIQRQIEVHRQDGSGSTLLKKYVTTGDIISDESQVIRSRATGVYEAYDISDGSKTPVVIKDIWVDVNRTLEGDIIADVLESSAEDEKSLFLTVLCHGIVQIDGGHDLTESLNIMRGLKLSTGGHGMGTGGRSQPGVFVLQLRKKMPEPSEKASSHSAIHSDKMALFSTNVLPYSGEESDSPSELDFYTSSKAHYRIVFKELGESLHHLSLKCKVKLSEILIPAFCDIIRALQVMWKKHYVHRDVSVANIIIYQGRAKLVDLEFAKKYATPPSSPVRTGSYSFQATEILSKRYLAKAVGKAGKPVFNPLHDLESLWWLGVWFAFCHFPLRSFESQFVSALTAPEVQDCIITINRIGEPLFRLLQGGKPDYSTRMDAFVEGPFLQDVQLDVCKFPGPIRTFCKILDNFREYLLNHFFAEAMWIEQSAQVDPAYFDGPAFTLYSDLRGLFAALDPNDHSESSSESSVIMLNDEADYHLWPIKYLQEQLK